MKGGKVEGEASGFKGGIAPRALGHYMLRLSLRAKISRWKWTSQRMTRVRVAWKEKEPAWRCPPPTPPLACYLFVCGFFWGGCFLHPWHMEIPRLGLKSELQLPAYPTATATQDMSHICDLHHSSQQSQILNPLSEARDRT